MKNYVGILRRARGLGQGQLARKLGIGLSTLSTIETGRAVPSVELAHRIASALGVGIEVAFPPRTRRGGNHGRAKGADVR